MDHVTRAGWLAVVCAGTAWSGAFAIAGATVVDGTGRPPRVATVVVENERIVSVGSAAPANVRVIRAEGHTLIPGLFDVHTHVPYASGGGQPDWPANLKAYLDHGVTSVADFGTYAETFEPMRCLWKEGKLTAPRVHYASRIATPGGHGAESGRGNFFTIEVLTGRQARTAMRRLLPYQPDAIKVFTDGWRYGGAPDMTSMEEAALAAIVAEAHAAGIEVLTHTVTLANAKKAARAGVDVIAHGVGDAHADAELIRIMKDKGTFYAPTLAVFEPRASNSPGWRTKRWSHLMANIKLLRAAGVRFASGTDSGMPGTHHGKAALREMQLLVQGGLTPLEAITAATSNSARALGVDAQRGTIVEGKLADLVLIEGRPHRRIADIENVRRVWLGGEEVDRAAKPAPFPVTHAHRRLDDFERPDGRTATDSLWVNQTDNGHDRTTMSYTRILRDERDHALLITARMAEKDRPFARMNLPLSPGAVQPVNASVFRGVQFDSRGEGEYRLRLRSGDFKTYSAGFAAGGKWQNTILFDPGWDVTALQMLQFDMSRGAGETAWLELDNIRFY